MKYLLVAIALIIFSGCGFDMNICDKSPEASISYDYKGLCSFSIMRYSGCKESSVNQLLTTATNSCEHHLPGVCEPVWKADLGPFVKVEGSCQMELK